MLSIMHTCLLQLLQFFAIRPIYTIAFFQCYIYFSFLICMFVDFFKLGILTYV